MSSNPIIDDFKQSCAPILRSILSEPLEVEGKQARWWLQLLDSDPTMQNPNYWGDGPVPTAEQIAQARKVLERIAAYRYNEAGERIA